MAKKRKIEVIARGVCVMDAHILLCHGKTSSQMYLPGGHIEFGETGRQALVREIAEEMGRKSKAGRFLGCCEHAFIQKGKPHAEINLVFELAVKGISPKKPVKAAEDWIAFTWLPLDELADARFEPASLVKHLVAQREDVFSVDKNEDGA